MMTGCLESKSPPILSSYPENCHPLLTLVQFQIGMTFDCNTKEDTVGSKQHQIPLTFISCKNTFSKLSLQIWDEIKMN